MKRFDAHPEEALELEKLGLLGSEERAALRAHLRECGACRAELWAHGHTAYRLEHHSAADAVLDRVAVAAALTALDQRAALKARWRRALPLVLGLALPLAALAATGIWRLSRPLNVPVNAPAPVNVPVPVNAPAPVNVPVPVPVPALPLSSSSSPAPHEPSAADLFRRAGDLKRAGQSARAVGVYRELQGRFSSSPEAQLSYVIAGGLLLDQGNARSAVAQFDRYLATSGPASEEALVGRAQALQRLGRGRDEASTWQQLLSRFPASVHAQAARARVAQLSATPDRP